MSLDFIIGFTTSFIVSTVISYSVVQYILNKK